MSNGEKSNIVSTILVVVLVAGMLLVFNFLRQGSGGGCMGGSATTTVQDEGDGTSNVQNDTAGVPKADSIYLKNSELNVRVLGWDSFVGFRIDKVTLKNYKMKPDVKSTEEVPVELLRETGSKKGAGHAGFEVLTLNSSTVDTLEVRLVNDSTVEFLWRDSLGNRTSFSLILDGYQVRVQCLEASSCPSQFRFVCADGLLPTETEDKTELALYHLYYRDKYKKVQFLKSNKVKKLNDGKMELEPGPYEWVALRNKYFTSIVMPTSAVDATVLDPGLLADQRIILNKFDVEFDVEKENPSFELYFGPQDYDLLSKMDHKFNRIVELGGVVFRWLGVIILKIFQFMYKIIGNYGVAIIIFALLIKLIFLPLSQIQQRSMQKMKMLQPKLKELQERFKDEPQRLNEETMRLYRAHGASPFAGCLPMLIQLPFFFGLYAVLRNAISLRGAPFVKLFTVIVKQPINLLNFIRVPAGEVTWLADLSQHDPFYILPVLMGVASVIQSMKTNTDPRQRFMTLIFPILITVVFLNFPSGLQLYWLVFNLLSLLEYMIFQRGGESGGIQWQKNKTQETPSAKNLQRYSRG